MSRREFVMLFGRGAAADICTADEPTRNESVGEPHGSPPVPGLGC